MKAVIVFLVLSGSSSLRPSSVRKTELVPNAAVDDLFRRFADSDFHMDLTEYERMWFSQFDADDDGTVTRLEFDTEWRSGTYGNSAAAPLFFMELDRVPDEVLNEQDFQHTFRIFDEDGDDYIDRREFRFNWDGLFNLSS